MEYSLFYSILVALGVGALIGIERERNQVNRPDIAGVRTFMLISILGSLTALISEIYMKYFLFVAFIGFVFLTGLGYAASVFLTKDKGLTTEITAVLVFLLGFLSFFEASRTISVMVAIAVVVILALKDNLHSFARRVEKEELFDTLKFLVITFIVLPLLPNNAVDPWGILNPYQIWLMVVLISGIGYFGYIMVKILGTEKGIGVTGFLGGLTSSTAVTTAMATRVKANKSILKPAVFATIVASTMMFPRVLLEVSVVNSDLLGGLLFPMGAMLVTGVASSFFIMHSKSNFKAKVKLESPLALKPALKFGAFFVVILVVSELSRMYLGDTGIYITAAFAGLADVDAITLSMATMTKTGDIGSDVAINAIVFASIVNTIMKVIYARLLGTKKFALWVGAAVSVIVLAGLSTLMFV